MLTQTSAEELVLLVQAQLGQVAHAADVPCGSTVQVGGPPDGVVGGVSTGPSPSHSFTLVHTRSRSIHAPCRRRRRGGS